MYRIKALLTTAVARTQSVGLVFERYSTVALVCMQHPIDYYEDDPRGVFCGSKSRQLASDLRQKRTTFPRFPFTEQYHLCTDCVYLLLLPISIYVGNKTNSYLDLQYPPVAMPACRGALRPLRFNHRQESFSLFPSSRVIDRELNVDGHDVASRVVCRLIFMGCSLRNRCGNDTF